MDWEYHLEIIFQNEPVTERHLLRFLGNLHDHKQGFRKDKPLWKKMLVPETETGETVLLVMFNHALSDGMSAIGILLSLLDDSPIDPHLPLSQNLADSNTENKRVIVQKRSRTLVV